MKIVWSILAVLAGLVFIVVTHNATDFILEHFEIITPPGKGFPNNGMFVGILAYRFFFSVIGCAISVRLAPNKPMLHAWILGGIGVILCILGIFAALAMRLPQMWYPVALLLITPICAWLGGKLATGKSKTEGSI